VRNSGSLGRDGYSGSGRERRTRKGREDDGEGTIRGGKEGSAREMGEGQKAQAEVSGQPYSKRSPSPVKEANA